MLPLPRRASRLQQGDRRRPGFLRAVGVAHVLEPDRPHPSLGAGGLGSAPYVPEGDVTQSQYHLLWPNTTINIAPGPQNIALERWVPDGLGRTIEVTDYWFGADVPPEIVQEVLDFDAQVGQEDIDLVLSVQAGLDSGTVQQGRLMRESEQLIADFQRRLYDAIS